MELISSLFLGTFLILYSVLYPIFKRPVFATYVVILAIVVFISFRLFRYLQQQTFHKKTVKQKGVLLFFWGLQVYFSLMIVWYLFVHFKTYKIM